MQREEATKDTPKPGSSKRGIFQGFCSDATWTSLHWCKRWSKKRFKTSSSKQGGMVMQLGDLQQLTRKEAQKPKLAAT
eukprot:4150673-Amphidinium_carterae.2